MRAHPGGGPATHRPAGAPSAPGRGLLAAARRGPGRLVLLALAGALGLPACQPGGPGHAAPAPPPVGHYAGTVQLAAGQPAQAVALELRHPAPGHYTAELTGPPALRFVADTVAFQGGELHLVRPGRPGEALALTLDGDFWRGTLRLDSVQAPMLLVRRGPPTPTMYRVGEVPQAQGSAWLFAPADVRTAGAGLALLPDAATGPAAAIWADALARYGLTVLLLPATDSASPAPAGALLAAARRLLRNTAGVDTANIGTWATGPRADAAALALAAPGGPRTAFFIVQNAPAAAASRDAYRALARQKLPMLGLYGGGGTSSAAAAGLRGALRSPAVRTYRAAGPDLLVPGPGGPTFAPGLPDAVVQWLPRPQ
ncbi:hypothetical protein [Hymenobacter sp. PAMC 26628]|uniref:hypothetical protein n=1 Tax=Hymenobacter sp. PAMC 26628 TaxID=1484118 RepID=UPI0007706223|nr:hypothetical protein [Hymenobacter sp. PAMC 26628]AMJ67170.1 hypothetical protein AXW84_18360 [Hymenobacter sp. PAMC 26628]